MKRALTDLKDMILGHYCTWEFWGPALGGSVLLAAGLALAWIIGWAGRHGLA